ncbi:MAG: DinB family protein [Acidimicrobiia bacterium]|nr:DinB family protein [Acidimicrobiia bacterium]
MIDSDWLARQFERNTWIIAAQTDGLTHEQSLQQTPYRVNCLNWTLGHLLEGRGVVLDLLGAPRVVASDETARYRRESDPILEDGPDVLPLDRLVAALTESGAAISAALAAIEESVLAEESEGKDGERTSLGQRVHFQYFHDTYHTGQTELLRQVAGIGDKVI